MIRGYMCKMHSILHTAEVKGRQPRPRWSYQCGFGFRSFSEIFDYILPEKQRTGSVRARYSNRFLALHCKSMLGLRFLFFVCLIEQTCSFQELPCRSDPECCQGLVFHWALPLHIYL